MGKNRKIQKSKLRFAGSSDIINRDRLRPLMDEFTQKRVTSVVAGAGYGKSTFVFQSVQYAGFKTIWYRLDQYDRDIVTFISYMISGLRNHYPDIAQETLDRIDTAPVSASEIETVFFLFLNDIESTLNEKIIFVLDDYHLVKDSDEINEFINLFLENLPSSVHLAITTRVEPRLRFSLLKARRDILEIREAELSFSNEEIEQLFSELFDLELQKESIQALHQKTSGWVSALFLFYHGLKNKNPHDIETLLQNLKGSHGIISNYLEENIFESLPKEIKDFLLRTSLFSSINTSVCNRVLQIDNSKEILSDLEKRHLFTFSADDDQKVYFFHDLFRDFLRTKLYQEYSRKEILGLHLNIASILEEMGEEDEALKFYLSGEQYVPACRLLKIIGHQLIVECRNQQLKSYLDEMPISYANSEPWLQYFKGCLLLHSHGEMGKGAQYCKTALKIFREQSIKEGIDKCLLELGDYYLDALRFHKAETVLKELIEQEETDPYVRVRAVAQLILISAFFGKMNLADQYFNTGIEISAEIQDADSQVSARMWLHFFMGIRYNLSGDFKRALEIGEQGKKTLVKHKQYVQTTWFHSLITDAYFNLFEFSKGVKSAEEGLGLLKKRGLELEVFPVLLIGFSRNLFGLGKVPDAIENAKESLRLTKETGHTGHQASVLIFLYTVYTILGDRNASEQFLGEYASCITECSGTIHEVIYGLNSATELVKNNKFSEALSLFKETEKKVVPWKNLACTLKLSFTHLYWIQNKKEQAVKKCLEALKIMKENAYDPWIVTSFPWSIPLLLEIMTRGEMQDYLMDVFKKVGLFARDELIKNKKAKNVKIRKAADQLLSAIPKLPSPGLKITCFGKFMLFRGEEKIIEKEWRYKKAKMLFKYLLSTRNRGFQPKEVLMELLWPEEEADKASNRLRVVMTSLRKTLEPELERGMASAYILSQGDSYMLDLGMKGSADIDEFSSELKLADKNSKDPEVVIRHFIKAEALYMGEFLEEDLYEEWCAEERNHFRGKYLNLLTRIISFYQDKNKYETCIEYANKYLKYDKYAENIYQVLMKCYASMDNIAMVLKTYENCRRNIVDDLSFPLKKETESLYETLMST